MLCDVDTQFIQRLEAGLINEPSVGVLEVLCEYPANANTTIDTALSEYDKWRRHVRESHRVDIHSLGFYWPKADYLNARQIISWINSFFVGTDQEYEDTVNGFCRRLLLHPYTVQRWIEGSYSPTVDSAIEQAVGGFIPSDFEASASDFGASASASASASDFGGEV